MKKLVLVLLVISVALAAYNIKTETKIIKVTKKLDYLEQKIIEQKDKN